MIGSLRGELTELAASAETAVDLIVDVQGVGYRVTVSSRCAAQLGPIGSTVFLAVHTHVREGAFQLYGFADPEERRIFELLLGAHGVGPGLGLSILGTLPPAALVRAITSGDLDSLMLVPGVGRKTAQRLQLELSQRFEVLEFTPSGSSASSDPMGTHRVEVREALVALGYSAEEVRSVLDDLSTEGSVEEHLREALTALAPEPMSPRREIVAGIVNGADDELDQLVDDDPSSAARPVSAYPESGEEGIEAGLRPRHLEEFVGQAELKDKLTIVLEAARRREQPVDHMLFAGPPGLGKTTLAGIVATEMGSGFRITSGPALARGGDLAAILTGLQPGDVLFIDEIHRLNRAVEEILYPAMEDFEIDIVIGKGPTARSVRLGLPRFTLIGATTRSGLITGPLRDRFGFVARVEHYRTEELEEIVVRTGRILNVECTDGGAAEIARRSRGTPRLAIRLLRRVRDFVEVRGAGVITLDAAQEGCALFGVDELGLDRLDRQLLSILCRSGRPIGLTTLSVSVGEDPETIEDVYEPFLMQAGLVQRTPRGRIATSSAYLHLGLVEGGRIGDPPGRFGAGEPTATLFESAN